jgi:hypothetical protein
MTTSASKDLYCPMTNERINMNGEFWRENVMDYLKVLLLKLGHVVA